MKLRHKEKTNTLIYCEQVLRESEREAEKESIQLIEKFKSYRKHKFRKIGELLEKDEDADLDDIEEEIMRHID